MATLNRKTTVQLNDVFKDWLTGGGIFSALNTYDVPWKNDINAALLDIEYHGNYSGSKNISPVIRRIMDADNTDGITNARKTTIANMIFSMNKTRWERLWETLDADYNPISNYDMTETETVETEVDNTRHNTGTVTDANTGTVTNANTGTQTNANTGTVTDAATGSETAQRYAFNSSTGSNTAGATSTNGNTRTDNTTETRTDNLTETRTDNTTETRTDNLTETEDLNRSESRSLSRSGNIGVTTSQQMLTQEREVSMWNIFYSVIFPDVDKILTIATYTDNTIYHGTISGGGGSSADIIDKLNEIETKVDTINTNTANTNTNINNARDNINANVNAKASAIDLSIKQLRTSTFNAIDGVTTRAY